MKKSLPQCQQSTDFFVFIAYPYIPVHLTLSLTHGRHQTRPTIFRQLCPDGRVAHADPQIVVILSLSGLISELQTPHRIATVPSPPSLKDCLKQALVLRNNKFLGANSIKVSDKPSCILQSSKFKPYVRSDIQIFFDCLNSLEILTIMRADKFYSVIY